MKVLSILILTIPGREHFLHDLVTRVIEPQLTDEVEVLIDDRVGVSIGEKRNFLLNKCDGNYCAFIDDDDLVSPNYIRKHLELIKKFEHQIDGIGFTGIITMDGKNPQKFVHKAGEEWRETRAGANVTYYRPLNHLNVVKTYIRRSMPFKPINHGEDYAQALEMNPAINPDHCVDITDEVMYFYNVRTGISTTTKRAEEIGYKL